MSVPSDNIRDDIFAEPDDQTDVDQHTDESTDEGNGPSSDQTGDHSGDQSGDQGEGQAETSSAGSSFSDPDTAEGGADAVPDTPDDVVENNIADADKGDYSRTGRDVVEDSDS